jgi:hypothetical protein
VWWTFCTRHDRTFRRCLEAGRRFRGKRLVKAFTKRFRGNVAGIAVGSLSSGYVLSAACADVAGWSWHACSTGPKAVRRARGPKDAVQRAAHTVDMPVRLHHIVIDAHDLPGLARFWTQALGWKVLSEREDEIVIGTDQNAPAGICFMPVTDPKTVKNRVHPDLTSRAADRNQEIDGSWRLEHAGSISGRPAPSPGLSSPTLRATSSAWCARRKRSFVEAPHCDRR